MLKAGGNAVDAAVAAAATLGVTEPYSAGIGGGGYFVYYNAKSGKVRTLDGRETAPMKMPQDAFIDPATGKPYTFTPDLVTSGASVGTPGTLATWDKALGNWGTLSLGDALAPATKVARRGFKVDETFRQQTLDNEVRFAAFKDSKKLFLPKGDAPKIGSIFRNPELADTYDLIAQRGTKAFYRGKLARLMSEVVRKPRTTKNTDLPVPAGWLTARDLRDYKVRSQRAAKTSYRGHDVYGMAPSSSGGTTVGEALNILERYDLSAMTPEQALHHYLEASALAYADRGKYLGDPAFVDVPTKRLLDDRFAAERACSLNPTKAATKPVAGRRRDVVRRRVHRRVVGEGHDRRRHREHLDHQPHGRRPVGQRRRVHPHHRADRRLGHGRAGLTASCSTTSSPTSRRCTTPPTPTASSRASARAARCRRRSCSRTASRSWRSARPAARRSSRPCCRCWSTASTSA